MIAIIVFTYVTGILSTCALLAILDAYEYRERKPKLPRMVVTRLQDQRLDIRPALNRRRS